ACSGSRRKGFRFRSAAIRDGESCCCAAGGRRCFTYGTPERSQFANPIRFQFHDGPFTVMETAPLLPPSLEDAFRRKIRNALALRTIFLSRQRLGKRLHDS